MATGKVEFHEGAPREGYSVATNEEATKTTTYLALFFDWFYKEVSESERDMIVRTLEWRIDHTLNSFCWRGDRHNTKSETMITESIALVSRSHQFEGFMDVLPACLALYEHGDLAREAFLLGVNYLVRVPNGFGFEEGRNEGAPYGSSKLKWLLTATICCDTRYPKPTLRRIPTTGKSAISSRI